MSEMVPSLFAQIPRSFLSGFWGFVVFPVLALLLQWKFAVRYAQGRSLLFRALEVGSFVSTGLLFVPYNREPTYNALGQTFVVDVILMIGYHIVLGLSGAVASDSVVAGPTYAMIADIGRDSPSGSWVGGVCVILICVPALKTAYEELFSADGLVLRNTVSLAEWSPFELYAAYHVLTGFVILTLGAPVPSATPLSLAKAVVFIVISNANVAAAWIMFPLFVDRSMR